MIAIQIPIAKQESANLSADAFKNKIANAATTSAPAAPKAKYPFPYHAGIFSVAAKKYKPQDNTKND